MVLTETQDRQSLVIRSKADSQDPAAYVSLSLFTCQRAETPQFSLAALN